jgi:PAS domain S-box-containing protein
VDEDRDFFLSQTGFPEPLASTRQMTGLTFCHYAIGREEPLLIPDTRADPRYRGVPAVELFGVAAYAGVPLRLARGETIGALCAIDTAPRPWTETEVAALRDLAACVVAEIELREATARAERERLERDVLLESALEGIYGMDLEGRCTFINRAGAQMLGYTPGEIAGRNMHALIHHTRLDGRPYPASECPIRRAFLTGQSSQVAAEALWRKDGSYFIAEYGCSPLVSEG